MGPTCRIDPTTHRTMSKRSYHGATSRSLFTVDLQNLIRCENRLGSTVVGEPLNSCPAPKNQHLDWLSQVHKEIFYLTTHSTHLIYGSERKPAAAKWATLSD